jgi:hypothetical protein
MSMSKPKAEGKSRQIALTAGVVLTAVVIGIIVIYQNWSKATPLTTAPRVGAALKPASQPDPPTLRFVDITEKAGIHFQHVNGVTPNKLLPETMGSGVAFLDYDNDGHPDILFVNSCYWPGFEQGRKQPPALGLYRNRGDGTFEEVPDAFGKGVSFYGMGVTAGDYDNDGFIDVFITGVGENHLYHNEPDGKGRRHFVDVTEKSKDLALFTWPTPRNINFLKWNREIVMASSAAFVDYDGDGLLDLFVCNYVTWSPAADWNQKAIAKDAVKTYSGPKEFKGSQCFLYHNLGNGRFEDVSEKAGIHVKENDEPVAKALGVIVCDVDDDGWPDLIVANDQMPNFFFHNERNGTFKQMALEAGIAFVESTPRGGMGIDWGEYKPGRCAVIICNYANEPNTFLRQERPRDLQFTDAALVEGLHTPSLIPVKWSVFFFDYDLDGRLDLLACNGNINREIAELAGQDLKQPVHLFWNCGEKITYVQVRAAQAGEDLFRPILGRGAAFADIDGDGYPDVVLTQNGGPAILMHNEGGTGHHWIRLKLEGDGIHSNRSAIGARVTVKAGDLEQHRYVTSSRGYLSQSELTLTIGLGERTKVDSVTVQWPGKNGGETVLVDPMQLAIDQEHTIRQDVRHPAAK